LTTEGNRQKPLTAGDVGLIMRDALYEEGEAATGAREQDFYPPETEEELGETADSCPGSAYSMKLDKAAHSPAHSVATGDLSTTSEVEECVRQNMLELERKFESLLDNFSEDVAQEVEREQSHLMLMQDQVDKQRELLAKQLNDVHRKMAQEEQQRANSQRILQETNQQLRELIQQQSQELQQLHVKLSHIENATGAGSGGWFSQLTSGVFGMFTVCSSSPSGYQSTSSGQPTTHETHTHIPASVN